ncbi:MAG: hypothetical protein Q9224_006794, partial [Gallowayella concinna]
DQPYPGHVECRNKKEVRSQAKHLISWMPPPQIQYGRRAVHEEELHNDVDAALSISVNVVVKDEQGRGDANMMEQEGFIGVLEHRSEGSLGARMDKTMAETSLTQKAYGVLDKVSAFEGCDGIAQGGTSL